MIVSLKLVVLAVGAWVCSLSYAATPDPRLEIPKVRQCVDSVKEYLTSSEYATESQNTEIIVACRSADPECVNAVGENLDSHERAKAEKLLPVVRACRGDGMGKCYRALINTVPSFDRNEAKEAEALLKKCE